VRAPHLSDEIDRILGYI